MKITKRQLQRIIKEEQEKLLSEANPDGTISDNEDNERDLMMAEVEDMAEELIRFIRTESERIGGGFRSPGIRRQALKLVAEIIHSRR